MSRCTAIAVLLGVLAATSVARAEELPRDQRQARELVIQAEGRYDRDEVTAQQYLHLCNEAAKLWAEDANVQLCLGIAGLFVGSDDARAVEHLEKAHELAPALKGPLFWLAEERAAAGDSASARDYYERSLAVAARDEDDRQIDEEARSWLSRDPTFVTDADVECFLQGTCPPTRQLEIIRIAPRSNGECEQRLMLTIPFELDSANLTAAARKQLDELGRALRTRIDSDEKLKMVGYASPEGAPDHNLELSRLRARSVAAYLKNGFGLSRIEASGVGSVDPVCNSNGEVNLERSRRVELVRGLGSVPCDGGAGS